MSYEVVETDVLVIGGGAAGLNAAIAAQEQGARVVVADKGVIERSGDIGGGVDHFLAYLELEGDWDTREAFLEYVWRIGKGTGDPRIIDVVFCSELKEAIDRLERIGVLVGRKEYRRHERDGFPTPSGKVELYSERLKEWGFDPIPIYRELPEPPHSDPDLAEEFPLIFTSWKSGPFRHSGGRQIKALRGLHPEPVVWIHPETAAEVGIEDGDWVYVETRRGRIRQKAKLTEDIAPRVVGVDYAWWFPEKGPEAQFGWAESNVNVLTDNKGPFNREMGTANLRGIACRVYKE